VYRWQGKVEAGAEWQLAIKATRAGWPALRDFVRARHPYEVPELLCLDVADGEPGYLAWVRENCG
jgi:periplasmic divalent cation tolerance protein